MTAGSDARCTIRAGSDGDYENSVSNQARLMIVPVAPGTTDRPARRVASVTRPCPSTSTATSMVASVARRVTRFDAHRLLVSVHVSRVVS